MKQMRFKLFGKIFLYTLLFLSTAITVFTFFYARQLSLAFSLYERRQLTYEIQTLLGSLEGKTRSEKIEAISDFSTQNKTFAFSIRTNHGEILYESPDFTMNETSLKDLLKNKDIAFRDLQEVDFGFSLPMDDNNTLYVARNPGSSSHKDSFTQIFPLSLILLAVSIAGAFIFARLMSRPIKRLAGDTVKMSKLEGVDSPPPRSDEIGLLAENVHSMYAQLKTTIVKLENEIRAGKELEEKQRYFFSAASHELKTPVTAATTILEGFIGKVIQPEEYSEYFHKCLQMMKTQGKLIADILDIVRFDEDVMLLQRESVNLTALIRSVLPSCQALAEAKKQKITIALPDILLCKGVKYMLSRVLSNVLMNAVQNTPEGGAIHIGSEPVVTGTGEDRAKICVLNTPAHIDETVISKIYQPFYRTDKSRSGNGENSGLGLTIVKKALDSMAISFGIENRDGGVLFWMELPEA